MAKAKTKSKVNFEVVARIKHPTVDEAINQMRDRGYHNAIRDKDNDISKLTAENIVLDHKLTKLTLLNSGNLEVSIRKSGIIFRQVRQKRILRRWILAMFCMGLAVGAIVMLLLVLSKYPNVGQ